MRYEDFTPAPGVTLGNCLQYIAAIEEAAERDILKIPEDERKFILGMVKVALRLAENTIAGLQQELEKQGEAVTITDEQLEQLRLMADRASKIPS